MKKSGLLILILALLFSSPVNSQDQIDKKSLAGTWMGRLNLGAVYLRVVFNLKINEYDSLIATLDSPDQGAKNIPTGKTTLEGKNIEITVPRLLAEYSGIVKNDTLIEGTFRQAGKVLPLDLIRQPKTMTFDLKRPQEPKPRFPYSSEEVTFSNEKAGINLAGTLTIPEGDGPFPSVILITGSGSQNRNEELMGHKPFLVIADHLSRNGIAVFRYDDRGVGQSQGTPLNATSADFADDVRAAFLYLGTRKNIDPITIGLAGHSEGGLIAAMVASDNPAIAFVISLAGPGVPGDQIMHRQNIDISRISGVSEKQMKLNISTNKKIFSVLQKEPDNKLAEEKITGVYKKVLVKQKTSPEEIDQALKQLNTSLNPVSYNWMRFFIATDPADFWEKVSCPVLALNGEKDLQVTAEVNLIAIEKALKSGGNYNVITMTLPGLNHLFQNCKTGLPAEYGEIEETFAPDVLKIMSEWIKGL